MTHRIVRYDGVSGGSLGTFVLLRVAELDRNSHAGARTRHHGIHAMHHLPVEQKRLIAELECQIDPNFLAQLEALVGRDEDPTAQQVGAVLPLEVLGTRKRNSKAALLRGHDILSSWWSGGVIGNSRPVLNRGLRVISDCPWGAQEGRYRRARIRCVRSSARARRR